MPPMASPTSTPLFQQPGSVQWILFETLTGFWSEASNDGVFCWLICGSSLQRVRRLCMLAGIDLSWRWSIRWVSPLSGRFQCCALVAAAGYGDLDLQFAGSSGLAWASLMVVAGLCVHLSCGYCSLRSITPFVDAMDSFSLDQGFWRCCADGSLLLCCLVKSFGWLGMLCFLKLAGTLCFLKLADMKVEQFNCCCHTEVALVSVVHRGALVYCKG
ncbi:hypothetical protein Peur_019038 [Populus x canadensis]